MSRGFRQVCATLLGSTATNPYRFLSVHKYISPKQKAYKQSEFLVTKSLGEKISVGVDTAVDRAAKHLFSFEKWTSSSIERRQDMMIGLAHQVWDMPVSGEAKA